MENLKNKLSKEKIIIIFLLVTAITVGILLRIAYLKEIQESPDFYVPLHDAEFKDFWAKGIAFGNWTPPRGQGNPFMEGYPLPNPPGYPLFLALLYRTSDNPLLSVRLLQIGIGVINIILVYLIAKNIFTPICAIFSAFGMATYWAFVYYDLDLNQQTIFICLILLFLFLTIYGYKKSNLKYFVLGGLTFGFSSWFRGEVFLLAFPLTLFIFILTIFYKKSIKLACSTSFLFFFFFLVPVLPITYYNYKLCGEFVPVSHTGECSLFIAFDPNTTEYAPYTPKFLEWLNKTPEETVEIFDLDGMTLGLSRELGKKERVTYREWRNHLVKNALRNAYNYPLQNLLVKPVKRFLYLFLPIEMDENKVLFYEIKVSKVLNLLPSFRTVISFSLIGILILLSQVLRKKSNFSSISTLGILLLLFFLLLYGGILSFIITGSRYRVPLIPIFLIFGGYGISEIFDRLKTSKIRELFILVLAFVILYITLGIHFLPYTPDRSRWLDERRRCYQLANQTLKGIAFFERWLIDNPGDADAHYHLGVLYLDAKNYTKAEKHFLESLRLSPTHKSSPYNLAIIYATKKDWEKATKYMEIALKRNPNSSDVWFTYGWICERLSNNQKAEEAYKKAISISPTNYRALNHLGVFYINNNKLEEAQKLLHNAVNINPNYPEAKFNLAQVYLKKRMPKKAVELLLEISCKYKPEEVIFKNLGIAYLQLLNYEDAEKYLYKAYQYSKDDEIIALLAVAYSGNGKREKSEKCIKELVYHKNTSQTLFHIGTAYELIKQYELAKDYYKRALEKDLENADAYAGLGNIALVEGDKCLAYRYFNKAYEIQPTQMGAWYNIILKKIEEGDLAKGREELEKFLTNYPEHIEAYYNLALVNEKLNRIEEAEKYYDEVLKRNPNHERALFSKGVICINKKDLDSAEQLFLRLSNTNPDEAYYHLGIIYSLKEEWEKAHFCYLKSYFVNPTSYYTDYMRAFNIGKSYDKLNCLEESLYFYSLATHLHPTFSDALEAYSYLQCRLGNSKEAKVVLEYIFEKDIITQWTFYNYALVLDKLNEFHIAIPFASEAEAILGRRKEVLHLIGELHRKIGNYDEAENYLKLAQNLSPQDFQVLKSLAFLKMHQERYLDADSLFQKCLEIVPNDTELLEGYADLCLIRGNIERAEKYYIKACKIRETPSALRKLGFLLADQNRIKESYEVLNKALTYEPHNPDLLMRIGDLLVAERRDEEAKKYYESATKFSKNNYLLLRNYAELLLRENDYENSKKYFLLALQLNPEDHLVKAGLGLIYAKENNFNEAKRILLPLSQIKTDLFEVNKQLADIFIQEGDYKNAVKYLKRCIIAQPDRKEFKEMLHKITSQN